MTEQSTLAWSDYKPKGIRIQIVVPQYNLNNSIVDSSRAIFSPKTQLFFHLGLPYRPGTDVSSQGIHAAGTSVRTCSPARNSQFHSSTRTHSELILLCVTSFQSSQTSSVDVSPAVTGRIDPSELHHLGALHDFLTRTLLRWMAESGRSELEPLRQGRRP